MERFEALSLQNLIRGRADRRFMDLAKEDVELAGVGDEGAVERVRRRLYLKELPGLVLLARSLVDIL